MCHVLIIEDEPAVAMLVRCVLEDEGASTFEYANTQDSALAAALANPPDLITSDVKLLAGTGPAAVAAIQSQLGPIPVIFLTSSPAECQPCNRPASVLSKPFKAVELSNAFHELVSTNG